MIEFVKFQVNDIIHNKCPRRCCMVSNFLYDVRTKKNLARQTHDFCAYVDIASSNNLECHKGTIHEETFSVWQERTALACDDGVHFSQVHNRPKIYKTERQRFRSCHTI